MFGRTSLCAQRSDRKPVSYGLFVTRAPRPVPGPGGPAVQSQTCELWTFRDALFVFIWLFVCLCCVLFCVCCVVSVLVGLLFVFLCFCSVLFLSCACSAAGPLGRPQPHSSEPLAYIILYSILHYNILFYSTLCTTHTIQHVHNSRVCFRTAVRSGTRDQTQNTKHTNNANNITKRKTQHKQKQTKQTRHNKHNNSKTTKTKKRVRHKNSMTHKSFVAIVSYGLLVTHTCFCCWGVFVFVVFGLVCDTKDL